MNAELLDDVQGALWTRDIFHKARVASVELPTMRRVVVAVAPSVARSKDDENADSIGIMVAGKGVVGIGYILEDAICKDSPAGWGRRVISAYRRHRTDRVVIQRNFGGTTALYHRTADPSVPVRHY